MTIGTLQLHFAESEVFLWAEKNKYYK